MNSRHLLIALSLLLSPFHITLAADEVRIRQIVDQMLHEKNVQIEQLESRVQQLEQKLDAMTQAATIPAPATTPAASSPMMASNPPVGEAIPTAAAEPNSSAGIIQGKLRALDKTVGELKAAASDKGLEISGFFDVNAKTGNSTDQTFSLGSVELDLDYVHDDHFGASSALVLCGNSSNADYGAPGAVFCGNSGPGGLSGGNTMAGIAVALIDWHLFNDRVPPRGRIFNNQGLHIQAGRFDLPFGTDYQNFANKDRVTVTAPLTTSRMQLGGYNSDGIRSYGSWENFNYSAFWTDAIYADDGQALGGRLGMKLGQRAWSVHTPNKGIEFGISHLSELDGNNHVRNSVYGADLSIGYGIWRLENEAMLLQAHQDQTFDADDNLLIDEYGNPIGKGHQFGYHSTLVVDLKSLVKQPIRAFARFSQWLPKQRVGLDYDGSAVTIADVSMLSLGFNYQFSDYLQLKFEYSDSLGTSTGERYFDNKVGIGQMVVSF